MTRLYFILPSLVASYHTAHRVLCRELRDCATRRVSFELSVSSIEAGDMLLHDLCEQFKDFRTDSAPENRLHSSGELRSLCVNFPPSD